MNSAGIVLICVIWGCVWIISGAIVGALHRRFVAELDARVEIRRQVRAELAARRQRSPRIRGCTCTHCHTLRPVVPGRPTP